MSTQPLTIGIYAIPRIWRWRTAEPSQLTELNNRLNTLNLTNAVLPVNDERAADVSPTKLQHLEEAHDFLVPRGKSVDFVWWIVATRECLKGFIESLEWLLRALPNFDGVIQLNAERLWIKRNWKSYTESFRKELTALEERLNRPLPEMCVVGYAGAPAGAVHLCSLPWVKGIGPMPPSFYNKSAAYKWSTNPAYAPGKAERLARDKWEAALDPSHGIEWVDLWRPAYWQRDPTHGDGSVEASMRSSHEEVLKLRAEGWPVRKIVFWSLANLGGDFRNLDKPLTREMWDVSARPGEQREIIKFIRELNPNVPAIDPADPVEDDLIRPQFDPRPMNAAERSAWRSTLGIE